MNEGRREIITPKLRRREAYAEDDCARDQDGVCVKEGRKHEDVTTARAVIRG